MKNKSAKKMDYQKLKRKAFVHLLIVVVAAVLTVVFLRSLCRGHVGDWIVDFLRTRFYLESQDALTIYQYTIRNNLNYLLLLAIAVFFVIFFRILMRWMTSYFDEVNAGIDALIDAKGSEIILSPEMGFMEARLNTLKRTLLDRERESQQAEQKKNDLVMYLAHDIKTPLTSVIGYLSLLDEAPDMPAEQKAKYVHITLEKAYRLEQLIDEFFEITRYHLQTIPLKKETIDLYYMLVQMADEAYPQLSAHGKQIQLHVPEDLLLCGDANKLARVFNNILKNAIAYSNENSTITITARAQRDLLVIEFQNVGTIPQDKLTSIFEKFYRLDDARVSSTGGSGLGLAIAKEIVTLHGGTICAGSTHGYTVFTVKLPIASAENKH